MKYADLRVGGKYELKSGHITTIKRISGDESNQHVFVDCMLKLSHRPAGRYVSIAVFAALVVREVPRERAKTAAPSA